MQRTKNNNDDGMHVFFVLVHAKSFFTIIMHLIAFYNVFVSTLILYTFENWKKLIYVVIRCDRAQCYIDYKYFNDNYFNIDLLL